MRRFHDLSILIKVFVAPGLLLAALALIGLLAVRHTEDQVHGMKQLDIAVVEPLRLAIEAKDGATLLHARLYALMSAAANETDVKRREAEGAALKEEAKRQARALDHLARALAGESALARLVAPLKDLFTTYARGAGDVIEIGAADAAYGVMMMGDANKRFGELRTGLDELTRALEASHRRIADGLVASVENAERQLIVLLVGVGLSAALAALLVGRAIAKPVRDLARVMDHIAGGNDEPVPGLDRRDEVGRMAASVQVFQRGVREKAAMEAREAEGEVAGRLRKRADLDALAARFEASVQAVVEGVQLSAGQLETSARTLVSGARASVERSAGVARQARASAEGVTTVAGAAEQIAASIAEIAEQTARSAQVAGEAQARNGETTQTVRALSSTSVEIGAVVATIGDIARQTNLLALNATIEAARAGEAGRGFAVVASEVKSLAAQTGQATQDVGRRIAGVQTATQGTVEAIEAIGVTISDMNAIAAAISAAVEQQRMVVNEITRTAGEVAVATAAVSREVEGVREEAAGNGAAAEQALGAATELKTQAARLSGEVQSFLATIRAA